MGIICGLKKAKTVSPWIIERYRDSGSEECKKKPLKCSNVNRVNKPFNVTIFFVQINQFTDFIIKGP